VPSITFILHQNKIIVECNEDGFTRENVEAICQVGNSNKGEDSTGEKGLGFKSVFMIASKVHIESKGYSFSFSFKEGEKELQKFTPENETSDNPPDRLTRITLFLVDDESHRREALKKFREVSPTTLLFLRKIKKLTIIDNSEDGSPAPITYAYQEVSAQREFLTGSITRADGSVHTGTKHFHIIKRLVHDIPPDGNRKSPHSEIKLAFPLSSKDFPPMEKLPDIFARLPVGHVGVGFYVSSYFQGEIYHSFNCSS
jgi:hypothetical protein